LVYRAIGSSFWPYYARLHGSAILPAGDTIKVPTGYAQFPREILKPPRTAAARVFTDIRRWSIMPRRAFRGTRTAGVACRRSARLLPGITMTTRARSEMPYKSGLSQRVARMRAR